MSEQDQDPRPLKASGETPAELVRALNALGRDRDGARLARVAQSLGPQLGPSGAAGASGLSGLTATKLGVIALALGLGAWGLFATSVPRMAAPATSPAPTTILQHEPAEQAPTERAVAPTTPSTQTLQPSVARSTARSSARSRAARASVTETAAQTTTPRASNAAEAVATPAPERPRAQPEQEAEPQAEPAREATQPPIKPSPTPPPPPSEVVLLQQARKLATSEPEAALRLLDQHAARFASGMLVPERELLAIEVLRHMGRNAEAERRLQRFEARYPESIHRRRLERSPATDDER
jgi:hypothetical protein